MNFISIGEKLKQTRALLHMKQKDFEDVNITRAYISMIEIDKRNLNLETAQVLLSKFQKRANELGINLNIDAEYLIRTAKEDAEMFCKQKISNRNNNVNIDEIIEIAENYNFNEILADSYFIIGESKFKTRNFTEACINYTKSLDYYINVGNDEVLPYLYNRLGHCKLNQLQYLEALNYFHISNNYALKINNQDINAKSTYNIALCYKKLDRIELSLDYLNRYFSAYDKYSNFSLYVFAWILRSVCYECKSLFDEAIEELQKLLLDFEDPNNTLLGYVYSNLGTLYLKKKLYEISLESFEMSQKIREKFDGYNLSHTLIEKSCVYSKTGDNVEQHKLLKQGIELAIVNHDIEYLIKGTYILGESYTSLNMNIEAEKVYTDTLNITIAAGVDNYKMEVINIYSNLSLLYLENTDFIKLKLILEKLKVYLESNI